MDFGMAHIDRGTIQFQRTLDDGNRTFHASAKAERIRQNNAHIVPLSIQFLAAATACEKGISNLAFREVLLEFVHPVGLACNYAMPPSAPLASNKPWMSGKKTLFFVLNN
jgi:hypothetical protein